MGGRCVAAALAVQDLAATVQIAALLQYLRSLLWQLMVQTSHCLEKGPCCSNSKHQQALASRVLPWGAQKHTC